MPANKRTSIRLVYSGPDPAAAVDALRAAGFSGAQPSGNQVYLYCEPGNYERATAAGNAILDAGISNGVCF